MDDIDPQELTQALAEIPLFKEIQRLVLTQRGPVNWEIAAQVARAIAGAGSPTGPLMAAGETLEEAVRIAELQIAQVTGEPEQVLTTVHVFDREGWAEANLTGFKPLIDPLAERLIGQITPPGGAPGITLLDALGPFAMGMQMGFLIGSLARSALGQYDLCLPRQPAGHIYFVAPNIASTEDSLGFEGKEFRLFMALHEVAHQVDIDGIGWVRPYFHGLLRDFVAAAELDPERLMTQMGNLGRPDQLNEMLNRPEDLIPLLLSPAQEGVMTKVRCLMSVLEGLADLTMSKVGERVLTDFGRMQEAMTRRRAERSAAERILEKMLGVYLGPEQYLEGVRFVRSVEESGRLADLKREPMALPDEFELKDAQNWLSRF